MQPSFFVVVLSDNGKSRQPKAVFRQGYPLSRQDWLTWCFMVDKIKHNNTKSIIKNLKQTKIFKDKDIIWNQVDIFSYKDLEVKGVVLSTKDPYVKYAIYYKPDKDIFCSFYIKSELHYVQKDTEKKLAGTLAYYDKNGNLLAKASYDKGKLVDVIKGQIKQVENDDSVQIQAFDCDWDCVQDCITINFEDLPGWLQFLCDAGCGACLFGGNPYGCSVCLGCLIGYVEHHSHRQRKYYRI
ncbi:hypothetical protein [Desulfoscipio geothermicus]|uniref:Uncharacterized protein n=1 Tax=Desulfoscipio geothermicus DSM 3669 TaxID=1121426 RepID=A0A1I6DW86_9FIRM|nr:hypothetical protein [Desulfoscipio geothermicus]SFR09759.1 hypothetical protein SAMN05660706_11952 [Desulfoscipio geothermicus DSM 3669]